MFIVFTILLYLVRINMLLNIRLIFNQNSLTCHPPALILNMNNHLPKIDHKGTNQTSTFLRDAGTLSPGDFHIGRWFWRNIMYISAYRDYSVCFFTFQKKMSQYSPYWNINFTWILSKTMKYDYFKQEFCRRF